MSTSSHAHVHEVLPFFNILTTHLNHLSDNITLHPTIRASAQCGLFSTYTTPTLIWDWLRGAGNGNGYKLQHFCDAGWPENWISVVEDLICKEWEKHYKPEPPSMSHRSGSAAEQPASSASSQTAGLGC
ncbi:hypothetical protein L227DRAFT_608540 [Lentinus tigrinus ALCF2SS1-6]|uniref:Uncharacterized protein n=1 Tax=Lentinus tigrinus ALCF2SS1-6 TaxID=1328759 RepID=A0A5C2SHW3_9APHY|nr:hypothetical protein L227DRAFT_608540 [Lentinus tigrinus ALCF2SS1-6]